MRIYLADLAHTYSVSDTSLTIPLNIGYIKAYAVAAYGDKVQISLFKHPERLLAAVDQAPPDIVGFANYGWNVNLNHAIGTHLRDKLPNALFVAGGPNIDPAPEQRLEFLQHHNYLDFVVIDGGEEPFAELIDWWQNTGDDYDNLPANLIWKDGDNVKESGTRKLTKTIDNIPSPYLAGYLDEFIELGMVPLFETNRGCPFQCTFCAWGSASKNLVRRFELDISIQEMKYVGQRSRATNWIVCDANFGMLKRDVEITQTIRDVKNQYGAPQKCHIWLAKNVTERNLEIGKILGDMVVPVMAVQSLTEPVLKNIKRGNISTDTYTEYQQKFHAIGSRTYSDLIVPLPGETLDTHIKTLRQMFDFEVDIIQSHNMRLLAGAETNLQETREQYGFRTRYRLIHGDAGAYHSPDGSVIKCFEYEESLRATSTLAESDMLYLRKLHFLVDFCWNIDVYKPVLKMMKFYGINPIDILQQLLTFGESLDKEATPNQQRLQTFWNKFDDTSKNEWFDDETAIQTYFADPTNFERLLNQEFDKINILFSVVILRDYKSDFDQALYEIIQQYKTASPSAIQHTFDLSTTIYPSLTAPYTEKTLKIPQSLITIGANTANTYHPGGSLQKVRLYESAQRRQTKDIILNTKGQQTLSKILNTQGGSLRDLRFQIDESYTSEKLNTQSVGKLRVAVV